MKKQSEIIADLAAKMNLTTAQTLEFTLNMLDSNLEFSARTTNPSVKIAPHDLEHTMGHILKGSRIQAIKLYQQITGCTLKYAKEVIDRVHPHVYENN